MNPLKVVLRIITRGYIYLVVPFMLLYWVSLRQVEVETGVSLREEKKYQEFGQFLPNPELLNPVQIKTPILKLPDHRMYLSLEFALEHKGEELPADRSDYGFHPISYYSRRSIEPQLDFLRKLTSNAPQVSDSPSWKGLRELRQRYETAYAPVREDYQTLKDIDNDLLSIAKDVSTWDIMMTAEDATQAQRDAFETAMREFEKQAQDLLKERAPVVERIIAAQKDLYMWLVELKRQNPDPAEGAIDVEFFEHPAKQGDVQVITAVTRPTAKTERQKLSGYSSLLLPFVALVAVHLVFVSKGISFSFLTGRLLKVVAAGVVMYIVIFLVSRFVFPYLPLGLPSAWEGCLKMGFWHVVLAVISLWTIWDEYKSTQTAQSLPLPPQV